MRKSLRCLELMVLFLEPLNRGFPSMRCATFPEFQPVKVPHYVARCSTKTTFNKTQRKLVKRCDAMMKIQLFLITPKKNITRFIEALYPGYSTVKILIPEEHTQVMLFCPFRSDCVESLYPPLRQISHLSFQKFYADLLKLRNNVRGTLQQCESAVIP